MDNASLIKLHAERELNTIDLANECGSPPSISATDDENEATLHLQHRTVKWNIFQKIEDYYRVFSVALSLIVFAAVCFIPCLLFIVTDYVLVDVLGVLPPRMKFNVLIQRGMGYVLLLMSGISVIVQDHRSDHWRNSSSTQLPHDMVGLVCFSHASALDAFILAAVVPIPCYTFCKKELFMLPFFGWMAAIFGGVAIDRSDQTKAFRSLRTVVGLRHDKSYTAVAISPEGTRSLNGLLLPFRKGPWHLWEQMGRPPVHPVLIMGAYDLMPPSKTSPNQHHLQPQLHNVEFHNNDNINSGSSYDEKDSGGTNSSLLALPGRVYVRLLPTITAEQIDQAVHGSKTKNSTTGIRGSQSLGKKRLSSEDLEFDSVVSPSLVTAGSSAEDDATADDISDETSRLLLDSNGTNPRGTHQRSSTTTTAANGKSNLGTISATSSGSSDIKAQLSVMTAADTKNALEEAERRSVLSTTVRRSMLLSMKDNYPLDAGTSLDLFERSLSRLVLLLISALDIFLWKHVVWRAVRTYCGEGSLWFELNMFGVFCAFMTAAVYFVKVYLPQVLCLDKCKPGN